ncbi:hypothetical protein O77CONTIG1_02574 [Leptolyngbya sp. O-77]|nr:hypothetical protein O77CONTIG1_02574 [Leptolyngbya sp. O-77]
MIGRLLLNESCNESRTNKCPEGFSNRPCVLVRMEIGGAMSAQQVSQTASLVQSI